MGGRIDGKRAAVLHEQFLSADAVLAVSKETDETKRGGKGTYRGCVEHLTDRFH